MPSDADLDDGALASLADRFLDLLLGLAHDLFDEARMNSAVGDEPLDATRAIRAGSGCGTNHDRLGRTAS